MKSGLSTEVLAAIASLHATTFDWMEEYAALHNELVAVKKKLAELNDENIFQRTAKELAQIVGRDVELTAHVNDEGKTQFALWIGAQHLAPGAKSIAELVAYVQNIYCDEPAAAPSVDVPLDVPVPAAT